jgi:cytochrome P450
MHVLQDVAMRRFNSLVMLPEWVPTPTHLRALGTILRLNRVVYGFIRDARASSKHRGGVLSALLEAQSEDDGSRMTDRQVRDEVLTLFLAGHETTALALTWTLMLLAQHPAVERRLTEEVAGLDGAPPTFDDRTRLPYTERVVLEGMRLYPPAWALSRTAIAACDIGGFRVPRGWLVLALPWVVHRDPRFFAEPERFDPDRWCGDFARQLPRHAYFPFGGGPRVCVGNTFAMVEAVLLLATLIQRFRFELVPGHPIVAQPAITLRPKYGLRMTVSRR